MRQASDRYVFEILTLQSAHDELALGSSTLTIPLQLRSWAQDS